MKGRVSAVLIERRWGLLSDVLSSPDPLEVVNLLDDSSVIYGLELFALVAAFEVWRKRFQGTHVAAYVDNDPRRTGSLDAQRNPGPPIISLCGFRSSLVNAQLACGFTWAPSPISISDLPTRGRPLPLKADRIREFPFLKSLILRFPSKWSINGCSLMDYV